uniref:Death effector domain containing 2 n=2 Tax=Nothobranchius furzeri TaxID=105023 RepID=A0A1A8B9U1_NOTFU
MATVHFPGPTNRDSLYWDETECLNYYGMLSLHEIFEIVGCQLTETDIEVLSFLLNESYSAPHPLDPVGWTIEPAEDDPEDLGLAPTPPLLKAWGRIKPKASQPSSVDIKPKSGVGLLLELERRGYLCDGNLEPLLQLLRVLTRHDLLPLVSHKRRRTVSPERVGQRYETNRTELVFGLQHTCRQTEIPFSSFTNPFTTDISSPLAGSSTRRQRRRRGYGWSRRSKKTTRLVQPLPPPAPQKVSCGKCHACICELSSFRFISPCPSVVPPFFSLIYFY